MKKLYLSITLLGMFFLMFAITMIPIQAYTTYQGVSLDTQITELENYTLNQVFNNANEFDGVMDTIQGSNFEFSRNILSFESLTATYKDNIWNTSLNVNAVYYYGLILRNGGNIAYRSNSYGGTNNILLNVNDSNYGFYSLKFESLTYSYLTLSFYNNNASIGYFEYIQPVLIDLDYLGLENINVSIIDYYYNMYVGLKNNVNLELFYNDGENFGYSQGYDTGYNEGGDYVATNNISLLSVFQLIIGVVMSMLGFIINIELFGISIASVLGTLAIGIAIIWTLKLIRG